MFQPGNVMIVPGSSFSCGYTIESIAGLLMIEPIPQLDGESGARARSALASGALHFVKIPEISCVSASYLVF
jgi:hypothetical protein